LTGLGLAAWMAEHAITTSLLPTPLAELFLQDLSALPADVCPAVALASMPVLPFGDSNLPLFLGRFQGRLAEHVGSKLSDPDS
jgi:hypothetical protein